MIIATLDTHATLESSCYNNTTILATLAILVTHDILTILTILAYDKNVIT